MKWWRSAGDRTDRAAGSAGNGTSAGAAHRSWLPRHAASRVPPVTRNRTNLLLALAPTAVYLLLFATSLDNLVSSVRYEGHRVSYAQFALPALTMSSMLAAATLSGTSLFQERLGRMEVELWSYPLARSSYIAGKLVASTCLVLVQSLVALALATALFSFPWPASHWAALILSTAIASLAFNGLYLLLATMFGDFQRFTVTINIAAPVLLFASPSFYPPAQMAPVTRWLSWADPVTYGIRSLRDSALFGLSHAWPWLLILACTAALTCPLIARSVLRRAREL